MSDLPATASRDTQRAAFARQGCEVWELQVDQCANTYGASPCTVGKVQTAQTAQAGTLDTLTLSASASAVQNTYKNMAVRIVSGAGAGQERIASGSGLNRATYSEQFNSWSAAGGVVTPNTGISPRGIFEMDAFIESTATSQHYLIVSGPRAGGRNTISVYVRNYSGTRLVALRPYGLGGGIAHAVFDASSGALLSVSGAYVVSTSSVGLRNGVYRISLTWEHPLAPVGSMVGIQPAGNYNEAPSYLGDGTSGVALWGYQHEDGDLTPYKPSNGGTAAVGIVVDRSWANNAYTYASQLDLWNTAYKSSFVTIAANDDGIADKVTVGTWPGASAQTITGAQVIASPTSLVMTQALEVRRGVGDWVELCMYDSATATAVQLRVDFNLTTGAKFLRTNIGAVHVDSGMSYLADGYVRIWMSARLPSSMSMAFRHMQFCDASGNSFGNTSGMYHWVRKAQLAMGVIGAPEYIDTGAAAVLTPDNTSVYDIIDRPNACYNTYYSCKDKAYYIKGAQVIKLVTRGVMSPLGESLRPYVESVSAVPTTLDIEAGLAARNLVSVIVSDETDNDSAFDPYYATRPRAPGGSLWPRWLARNRNYFGRPALRRTGFVTSPWDWSTFLTERYIIDNIALQSDGTVKFQFRDPLKLLDNNKLPRPCTGKLVAELADVANAGLVVAATATTVQLDPSAQPVDGRYVGFEVYIVTNTGAGQRRVISAYDGASRTATLASAWQVVPTTISAYHVSALSISLTSGTGAQYADPATSGKAEYIRIGAEIIRYSSKSGDVLSWPDATYRAQFGSVRGSGKVGDVAQLCRAWLDTPIATVLTDLYTEGGVDAAFLSPDLASECAMWYGPIWNITACISAPEQVRTLVGELLVQIGAAMWWAPQLQRVEFLVIAPPVTAYPIWTDEANLTGGNTAVQILDAQRVTSVDINFGLRDATANLTEPRSFANSEGVINLAAETVNEYGDTRPATLNSRWFSRPNALAMFVSALRKTRRLYHAPKQFNVRIDYKDYSLPIGRIVGIQSRGHVDVDGWPLVVPCLITRIDDRITHVEVTLQSMGFTQRYGAPAPAATPDFPTDTTYLHIADANGLMPDGSEAYYAY